MKTFTDLRLLRSFSSDRYVIHTELTPDCIFESDFHIQSVLALDDVMDPDLFDIAFTKTNTQFAFSGSSEPRFFVFSGKLYKVRAIRTRVKQISYDIHRNSNENSHYASFTRMHLSLSRSKNEEIVGHITDMITNNLHLVEVIDQILLSPENLMDTYVAEMMFQ